MSLISLSAKSSGLSLSRESVLLSCQGAMDSMENVLQYFVSPQVSELMEAQGLFDRSVLEQIASQLYDYGVDGKATDFDVSHFSDFVYFIGMASTAAGYYPSHASITAAEEVACIAHARRKLDWYSGYEPFSMIPESKYSWSNFDIEAERFEDGTNPHFSLRELALLARMDEKSVRNMTHTTQTGDNRLHTLKVGSKTMVSTDEALRWLRLRKGFKPSRWMEG